MADDSSWLTLRLFGPFDARLHGIPLARMRTRKGQWLLALLALRDGAPVDRDALAGLLWPESGASAALTNLRGSLKDLRRALGPEAGRLRAPTSRALCLDRDGMTLDVAEFDVALSRQDPDSPATAVSLYRGPLLADCAEEWVLSERARCEAAYVRAVERLAAHATATDDPARAEEYLRLAVAVDPLRESTNRALMSALAGGGNLSGALLTYRELRLRLHREMNAAPDPETVALFQRLRADAQHRARCSSTFTTPQPASREESAVDAAPRLTSPSRRAPSGRGSLLPIPPTRLIAREAELLSLSALLNDDDVRLLTLTGPGGVGKTRLALEAASDLSACFPDGIFFVDLAPIRDPGMVVATLAQAVRVRESDSRPLLEAIGEHLIGKQALLLIDNFEHLLTSAPLLSDLLASTRSVRLLVTSRAALRLRGEREFPVAPLCVPGAHPTWQSIGEFPSALLFQERARDVKPHFAITPANAEAVAEICRRLDGLPLAIELAAARSRLFTPQALLARLDDRLGLLVDGPRDLPARQQTLDRCVRWSYDLLDEPEQRLFRQMAVFVGGCSLAAAEAIGAANGVPGKTVLRRLASLLNNSLLQQGETALGEPRFRLLETVREFAHNRLAGSGEAEVAERQHAQYFRTWIQQGPDLSGPFEAAWHDQVESEHENLKAAVDWFVEHQEGEIALRMATYLEHFWEIRGYWTEGRERLVRLLSRRETAGRTAARAGALVRLFWLISRQGDVTEAHSACLEALSIYQELDNPQGIAGALHSLGCSEWKQQRYSEAQRLLHESLALRREIENQEGVAASLGSLAGIAVALKEDDAALSLFEQSLAILRVRSDRFVMSRTLNWLGRIAFSHHDHETARLRYEEALAVSRELGDKESIATSLRNLGRLAEEQGDLPTARRLWEESLMIRRDLGNRSAIVGCLQLLAEIARRQGDAEAADAYVAESRTLDPTRPAD